MKNNTVIFWLISILGIMLNYWLYSSVIPVYVANHAAQAFAQAMTNYGVPFALLASAFVPWACRKERTE